MDRGAWRTTVRGVAERWTPLIESGSAVFFQLLKLLHHFLPALEVLISAPSCEWAALRSHRVQGVSSSLVGLCCILAWISGVHPVWVFLSFMNL